MNNSHAMKKEIDTELTLMAYEKTAKPDIKALVAKASQCIAPVWPLETFIACNPLQGLEHLPFEEAFMEGTRLFGSAHAVPKLELVNKELIKWCGVFLDVGQGTIQAPHREKGFYKAFKELSRYDDSLHQGVKSLKTWLDELPDDAEDVVEFCLSMLGVAPEFQESFIRETFSYLPGWAGYIKWRTDWKTKDAQSDACPVSLMDFLAVRLVITAVLWPEARWEKKNLGSDRIDVKNKLVKMEHAEKAYQAELLSQLMTQEKNKKNPARPDAQLVFCIDVRSEPMRRSIEALGSYETLGFAGFFGLPVRVHELNSGVVKDSCPVLLKPVHDVHEHPVSASACELNQCERGKKRFKTIKNIYQSLKYNFATPFALVETLGIWCGLSMFSKTLAPGLTNKTTGALSEKIQPTLATLPLTQQGISLEDQAKYGESALRMMGLTDNFGRLVVFCGHRSTTENNPYASALDCGACGGNHGGSNAKILADILNNQNVRQILAEHGIHIPENTDFHSAEHNTTTDEIILHERLLDSEANKALLVQLKHDLAAAKKKNIMNRSVALGLSATKDSLRLVEQKSMDWAEVRPEWGLARNAAFIVGPRQLTQNLDLEGRCFLHSYDWSSDADGTFLETILTAPMVVAEWINTQYLFSTLDNVSYGSGSKITHNVVGQMGIMQGNGSDLMHGLPLQSVKLSDQESYHEPQRLLTVVYGPKETISAIIERQDVLKTLFFNGWVRLIAIDPNDQCAYQLDRKGQWMQVH